jgi:hypothetical protein
LSRQKCTPVTKSFVFRRTSDNAATRLSVPTWFQRSRFAESVSAPNTYRGSWAQKARTWKIIRTRMPARSRGRGHGSASPSYYGGSGAGQNTETVVVASSYEEIGARMCVQSNARDSGIASYGATGIPGMQSVRLLSRHRDEDVPMAFQLGTWARTPCPKLLCMSEERLHVEGFLSLEHEVDSPADLVGKD